MNRMLKLLGTTTLASIFIVIQACAQNYVVSQLPQASTTQYGVAEIGTTSGTVADAGWVTTWVDSNALLLTGGTVAGQAVFAKPMTSSSTDNMVLINNQTVLGSGTNGPATSQNGLGISISISKAGWYDLPTTAKPGQVQGISLLIRNGGGTSNQAADQSSITFDNQSTDSNYGFVNGIEGTVSTIHHASGSTDSPTQKMDVQIASLTGPAPAVTANAYYADANIGVLGNAFNATADKGTGASWTNLLVGQNQSGQVYYNIDGSGDVYQVGNLSAGGNVFLGIGGTAGNAPRIDLYYGNSQDERIQNDAVGQLTFSDANGTSFQIQSGGIISNRLHNFYVGAHVYKGLTTDTLAVGVKGALTAAGTTLATALPLTAQDNFVTTVPSGGGVTLPSAPVGEHVVVGNRGTNALAAYPFSTSDQIEAMAAGAASSIAAGGTGVFVRDMANHWYRIQ